MQKQGKKINGIKDLDSPQMELMRATVIEQELSARSWKAYYEKMYYSIEAEKLEEPYREYQERAKKRLADEKAKMDEFMKTLNAEIVAKNEADPAGNIGLEEQN
jgi:hypothetical protein